jgi:phage gpG-like protein
MPRTQAALKFRATARQLRKYADRSEDVSAIWPKVGNVVARSVRRVFGTRGRSINEPWKPLAVSTRKQRLALGYGNRNPLVRSGELKSSFTSRPMSVERYKKDSATFGSNLELAVWQQYGTIVHGKRRIPPRTLLKLVASDREKIKNYVIKHIMGRVVKDTSA